jgi:hypothetical protein
VALKIATQALQPVESCLSSDKRGLSRLVLEAVGIKLASTEQELLLYMQSTLLWQQNTNRDWLGEQAKFAMDFLVYNEIIVKGE